MCAFVDYPCFGSTQRMCVCVCVNYLPDYKNYVSNLTDVGEDRGWASHEPYKENLFLKFVRNSAYFSRSLVNTLTLIASYNMSPDLSLNKSLVIREAVNIE